MVSIHFESHLSYVGSWVYNILLCYNILYVIHPSNLQTALSMLIILYYI